MNRDGVDPCPFHRSLVQSLVIHLDQELTPLAIFVPLDQEEIRVLEVFSLQSSLLSLGILCLFDRLDPSHLLLISLDLLPESDFVGMLGHEIFFWAR